MKDSVLFSEKIDDRFKKTEQNERQQRPASEPVRPKGCEQEQAHNQKCQKEAMAQQEYDRCCIQCYPRRHKAQAPETMPDHGCCNCLLICGRCFIHIPFLSKKEFWRLRRHLCASGHAVQNGSDCTRPAEQLLPRRY